MRRAAHQIPFPEASPAAADGLPWSMVPRPTIKTLRLTGPLKPHMCCGAIRPADPVYGKHLGSNYLLFGERGGGFCDHRDPENKQDIIYTLKKHLLDTTAGQPDEHGRQ